MSSDDLPPAAIGLLTLVRAMGYTDARIVPVERRTASRRTRPTVWPVANDPPAPGRRQRRKDRRTHG